MNTKRERENDDSEENENIKVLRGADMDDDYTLDTNRKRTREEYDEDELNAQMNDMNIQQNKRTMEDITRPSLPLLREKRDNYYKKMGFGGKTKRRNKKRRTRKTRRNGRTRRTRRTRR